MAAIEDLPGARTVTAMDDLGIFGSGSSAAGGSEDGSSGGVSRRTFLSGVVVVGAAAGLASVGEGALSGQPALAATTPPTGPPTTTVPLPTTTAPEQLLLTWGNDPATRGHGVLVGTGHGRRSRPRLSAYSTAPISATRPGRTIALPEPQPLDVTRALPERVQRELHRRAERARRRTTTTSSCRTWSPTPRYYYQVSDGATPAPSTAGCELRDRARRPGPVPLLQLRRPGNAVVRPQRLRQPVARVVRQLLLRGQRDRESR